MTIDCFKCFWWTHTHVLFWGHWYPCFWNSGDVSYFKARVGSALIAFCGGECNAHFPRSTSGATSADLLTAGIATSHFQTCISRGGNHSSRELLVWTDLNAFHSGFWSPRCFVGQYSSPVMLYFINTQQTVHLT